MTRPRPSELGIKQPRQGNRYASGSFGVWSLYGDRCSNCGTSERPHKAYGLCRRCYHAKHFTTPEAKLIRKQRDLARAVRRAA
jgi:hypothetical protein